MTNPSKRKGDKAELEVQALLQQHLGVPARRKLGAGRQDDMGDIDGVTDTTIQVANRKDVCAAVRAKPLDCEDQQQHAGTTFGATFLRLRGGEYRVVLTVEQFCTFWREAQQILDARAPHPVDQTVCRHGLRFDQHCKECYLQGFCCCPECTEDYRA